MNCIEARRMVTPFLKKELSDKDAEQFLKHIERCGDCMDELETYFMVYRAFDTLDSGAHHEYDFQKMMREEIKSVKRGILRRKILHGAGSVILILTEILLIFSVYTGYQMRNNEIRHNVIQRAIHRLHAGRYEELQSENYRIPGGAFPLKGIGGQTIDAGWPEEPEAELSEGQEAAGLSEGQEAAAAGLSEGQEAAATELPEEQLIEGGSEKAVQEDP